MAHQLQQALRLEEHELSLSCTQGHEWQPTVIIGYFQCSHCQRLAACHVCVSNVRGQATLVGMCQAHQHLRSPETPQREVLG